MKSFLTYVAQDIIQKYGNNQSDIAIVFPNKRASLFLNEQLADHTLILKQKEFFVFIIATRLL